MADTMFDHLFGGWNPTQGASSIGQWIQIFTTRGAATIARRLMSSDPCEYDGCKTRYFAGTKCVKCRKVVCLGHAFLTAQGEGFCFACANVRAEEPEREASPPERPRTAAEDRITLAAYAALGLTPHATEKEVNRAHRDLRAKHHPDKHGISAAERKRREEKSKEIGQAFDVIRKIRGW